MPGSNIGVRVYRGETVESQHRVAAAVVNAHGDLVAKTGDHRFVTYMRSSLKPYQLAPMLAAGGEKRWGFTDAEVAIMSASHSGESAHVKTVAGILEKLGLDASALKCGAHAPYYEPAARALTAPPTVLHNNCSGKHSGMLALALLLGENPDNYLHPDSLVQRAIRDLVVKASGAPATEIRWGIDGCSAPNCALPLANGARLFATVARPERLGPELAPALTRIGEAMRKRPDMVSGTDRFDLHLMEAADGRLLSKVGGEAVQGVADFESGLGMLLKVEDGSTRASSPATVEALRQLSWLDGRAFEVLGDEWRPTLTNHAGLVVGRIEPCLVLENAKGDPLGGPNT
ncbi:MAG: asparaginase [Thermoplasmatota archaeon]